jgi:hypothetical protein
MSKPTNPYTRLLESFREYVHKVTYRHRKTMWVYPKGRLNGSWNLTSLSERVAAADQLGYDVQLVNTDDGLGVVYVKRVPEAPYEVLP